MLQAHEVRALVDSKIEAYIHDAALGRPEIMSQAY